MSDETAVLTAGPIRKRLRERLKARIVREAVAKGATAEAAGAAFDEAMAESDRPFLDWLMDGGFEKLLQIVLRILDLLA